MLRSTNIVGVLQTILKIGLHMTVNRDEEHPVMLPLASMCQQRQACSQPPETAAHCGLESVPVIGLDLFLALCSALYLRSTNSCEPQGPGLPDWGFSVLVLVGPHTREQDGRQEKPESFPLLCLASAASSAMAGCSRWHQLALDRPL